MVGVQPRRVQLVVARRAAEIPDVRLAISREQRIARELVARPLADHRAGGVADIVLVEREQRAETGVRERGAHAREAVPVQPAEIDALLEIDLRAARRLQRSVPAVRGIDVVRTDDLRLRMPAPASHGNSSSGQFYNELAGDKLDPPPDARRRFAVAGVLGALRLHAKPGKERPPPALRRGDLDRLGDAGGTDPTRLEMAAPTEPTREPLVRPRPRAPGGQ